jgi:hypothetical protein
MALFLLLIIVAIALGIIGAVVKGLLYLLIIGVVVLVAGLIFLSARLRGADAPRPGETMTAITKPAADSAAGTVR